jgi:hypothetical protein
MAEVLGVSNMFTPPLSEFVHCPRLILFADVWRATSEEEQAVSTGTAGPWNPNVKDTLPAATLIDRVPVADRGE